MKKARAIIFSDPEFGIPSSKISFFEEELECTEEFCSEEFCQEEFIWHPSKEY